MNDESIKKTISKNITKYREQAGLTQKELAKRLGVAPSRVSNWEAYSNCPTIDILFDVCDVLGVSINDIYGVYPTATMNLSYEEQVLLKNYKKLDPHGQKTVNYILDSELSRTQALEKQTTTISDLETKLAASAMQTQVFVHEENEPLLNAAHARTDIAPTEEELQHDEDIMNDDNF